MCFVRRLAFLGLILVFALVIRSSDFQAQETEVQLQQLVAPIALYPDQLLAEALAASTYPEDVDAAANWLSQNAALTSDQVADAVGKMNWDDSVKSLTEFPTVLSNMAQNLSWTSALGDAYYNQPDDVMDAVQTLRQHAIASGSLKSNNQIKVSHEDGQIVIESASSDIVFIPDYDCWVVYGSPIAPWPDFVFAPRVVRGPGVLWNINVHIGGAWSHVNWGWKNWKFDWRQPSVIFNRKPYVSHSLTVIDRRHTPYAHAVPGHGPEVGRLAQRPDERRGVPPAGVRTGLAERSFRNRNDGPPRPLTAPRAPADPKSVRGFPESRPRSAPGGTHPGALNGTERGGIASRNSQRGQASMQPHLAPQRAAPSPRAAAPARPPARSAPRPVQPNRGGRGQ